jgi:hypothetical protein
VLTHSACRQPLPPAFSIVLSPWITVYDLQEYTPADHLPRKATAPFISKSLQT